MKKNCGGRPLIHNKGRISFHTCRGCLPSPAVQETGRTALASGQPHLPRMGEKYSQVVITKKKETPWTLEVISLTDNVVEIIKICQVRNGVLRGQAQHILFNSRTTFRSVCRLPPPPPPPPDLCADKRLVVDRGDAERPLPLLPLARQADGVADVVARLLSTTTLVLIRSETLLALTLQPRRYTNRWRYLECLVQHVVLIDEQRLRLLLEAVGLFKERFQQMVEPST